MQNILSPGWCFSNCRKQNGRRIIWSFQNWRSILRCVGTFSLLVVLFPFSDDNVVLRFICLLGLQTCLPRVFTQPPREELWRFHARLSSQLSFWFLPCWKKMLFSEPLHLIPPFFPNQPVVASSCSREQLPINLIVGCSWSLGLLFFTGSAEIDFPSLFSQNYNSGVVKKKGAFQSLSSDIIY